MDLLWIMRDPGPEVKNTHRLCMVHNLRDPTSRNALKLLRHLGIGEKYSEAELEAITGENWLSGLSAQERARLRGMYATNAVMHGGIYATKSQSEKTMRGAARKCWEVLRYEIAQLRPHALLAFGDVAADALWRIERNGQAPRPIFQLWDGKPRVIRSLPAFFLFHHSPLGLLNAEQNFGLNVREIWTITGEAIRQVLGWS